MHDHPELEPICFFCGEDAGHDHMMLGAFWDQGHGVGQEHWPVHARCLLERMSAHTRAGGGPFVEAITGESALAHDHDHDHGHGHD